MYLLVTTVIQDALTMISSERDFYKVLDEWIYLTDAELHKRL